MVKTTDAFQNLGRKHLLHEQAMEWKELSEFHPDLATKSDMKELRIEMMFYFKILYVLMAAIFLGSCFPIFPILKKIFGA